MILNYPIFSIFLITFCITLCLFPIMMFFLWKEKNEYGDWGGKIEKRFNWKKFQFERGRFQYKTNAFGETLDSWWKKES